jgi:hypothetical protein
MTKNEGAPKEKAAKGDKPAKADKAAKAEKVEKPEKGDKPSKADKKAAEKAEKAAAAVKVKEEAPPRPPVDLRLKVLKKFHGKFLPKGILRTRQKALMDRWNSGEDHGGVTVEELKSLLADWRGTQEKPPRMPKA